MPILGTSWTLPAPALFGKPESAFASIPCLRLTSPYPSAAEVKQRTCHRLSAAGVGSGSGAGFNAAMSASRAAVTSTRKFAVASFFAATNSLLIAFWA